MFGHFTTLCMKGLISAKNFMINKFVIGNRIFNKKDHFLTVEIKKAPYLMKK